MEYGAALHLRTVAVIVEDCANVTRCVSRPEPHGSNQARGQSLLLIVEHLCRQLTPYRAAHRLQLVHLANQHEPLRPSTQRTTLFHATVGQTRSCLKSVVVPQTRLQRRPLDFLATRRLVNEQQQVFADTATSEHRPRQWNIGHAA